MTDKGEFASNFDSVLSFNRKVGMSYSIDINFPGRLNVSTHYSSSTACDNYQMIFVLKGNVQVQDKRSDRQASFLSVNEHNIYRVTPGRTLVMTDGEDEAICINLNASFLNRYLPANHPIRTTVCGNQPDFSRLFTSNLPITPEMSSVLQHISRGLPEGFYGELTMESKTIELLCLQLFQFEQFQRGSAPQLEKEKRLKMHKAKEIILNHTGRQLPLKTLAHMVGTNEFDLKRDFKIVFDNTVYGYLKQYKMEEAKAMLLETDLSVAQISRKLGYGYATHFTSAFKKYFGYLPNTLRGKNFLLFFLVQELQLFLEESWMVAVF